MMLLARIGIHRAAFRSPLFSGFRTPSSRSLLQGLRRNTTASTTDFATKKPVFPERLLIYHGGTGRSAFLGCLRVTTIFMFAFFTFVVAPTHFYAEDEPIWVAPAVVLSGVVPMVFVSYIASPFVANIHLRLPRYARNSRQLLTRYWQTLPKDAKLDITTMNFIGKPRVSLVNVSDLKHVKQRFGMVNYIRDTKELNLKRPWWMGKAVKQFGVHGGTKIKDGSGIWEAIAKNIAKRSN